MNEWKNEWMDDWMNEWMNEWMNYLIKGMKARRYIEWSEYMYNQLEDTWYGQKVSKVSERANEQWE